MSTEAKLSNCPSDAELRAFVEEPLLPANESLAAHVYVCDHCRDRMEDFLHGHAILSGEDRQAIQAFVDGHCKSSGTVLARLEAFVSSRQTDFFTDDASEWRLAAASGCDGGPSEQSCEDVRFVFASEEQAMPDEIWRAELDIPGSAAGATPLAIRVLDRGGAPAGDGRLTLAGAVLAVENGTASIPFDLFLAGIRNSSVSYCRAGGRAVVGDLVFF